MYEYERACAHASPSILRTLWCHQLSFRLQHLCDNPLLQTHAVQHREATSVPHPEGHVVFVPGSCYLTVTITSPFWLVCLHVSFILWNSSTMQQACWSSTSPSSPTLHHSSATCTGFRWLRAPPTYGTWSDRTPQLVHYTLHDCQTACYTLTPKGPLLPLNKISTVCNPGSPLVEGAPH